MDSIIETLNKKKFIYFGVYVDAAKNKDGELKKRSFHPSGWQKMDKTIFKNLYDYDFKKFRKPNGMAINTRLSNISTIDVDKPNECDILDTLLKECNFIVKTRKGYHFYFNKNDLPRRKMCGIADINTELLYLVPEYQEYIIEDNEYKLIGDKYKYEIIKNKKLNDMSDKVYNWCLNTINNKEVKVKGKETTTKNKKEITKVNDCNIINNKFTVEQMNIIFSILYDNNLFNDYDTWRDIAFMARHLNNSEEVFQLYLKYSRMVKGYEDEPEDKLRNAFYQNNTYIEDFNSRSILYKCKKLDETRFYKHLSKLYDTESDKYEKQFININSQYIYTDDNKKYFNDWINNKKCMMIKSAYGTGKTYGFKQLIKEHQFKKILFITYRQSLAWNFYNELNKEFNFVSYQDREKNNFKPRNVDRLIIQLDSLHLLKGITNLITGITSYNKYDLIVMDEIEGLLNHLSYEKINQLLIEETLRNLLILSNKVLCLDGDLNNRSLEYMDMVLNKKNILLLRNEYKPNKKHFIFMRNKDEFEKLINDDITIDKNKICVVSLSKTYCEYLYGKYNDSNNNVIIHDSIDKNKDILMDVHSYWNKCNLLTYSPSVEAGVDYTKKDFIKCYAYITANSTTPRAFCQMLNRIRYFKDNNIFVYIDTNINNLNICDTLFNYDDIKNNVYNDFSLTPLINTLIHNTVEEDNKKSYFFPALIKLLIEKGHTYEIKEDNKQDTKDDTKDDKINMTSITIEILTETPLINKDTFNKIIEKERTNNNNSVLESHRHDYYAKEKYLYCSRWCLDEQEFNNEIDNIYNNNNILKNYRLVQLRTENRNLDKDEYLKKIKFDKIDIVKNILDIVIKDNVINFKDCENIMNSIKYKSLFGTDKDKDIKIKTLSKINSFIENYGFTVITTRKNKSINGIVKKISEYKLDRIDIIKDYENRYYSKLNNNPLDNGINRDLFLDDDFYEYKNRDSNEWNMKLTKKDIDELIQDHKILTEYFKNEKRGILHSTEKQQEIFNKYGFY